ncbi:unnamed protein product [Chondrus crispus]|uniref:Integrase catalytic domain-containing protein n=1 Tax=Chondrus crispus TaxID=2769 RepID=R7Q960_CHOCR|nr:unnamed protein product [Chondrus crispus]CDF34348.1 unnamed protein product [Chondrus crispus]|eukprot:XP_005714167.1 unnamed protein product [Chondrus crispus]
MDWEKEIDLSYIDDDKIRGHVLEMLRKHSSLWSGALGTIQATEHRIPLEPGTKPIRSMPYRNGLAMREMVAKEVNKMLNAGRRLNAKTAADSYPLPRMDDCIDSLGDAAVFTTLDCNSGYWQIPVAPEDRDKTTFTTHMGTFRHFRRPFGLKGALATFQRALDIILSGDLDTVLSLLRSSSISLKLKKCSFFRPKVHYLGHVISPGKLSVADTAADAFKTFKFPRTLTQVRSFFGACNVYRRFVKGFAKIARPLTDVTRKDSDPDFYNPTELQLQAFENLKKCMIAPPILALPPARSSPNDWRPVGYWSYSLSESERNYSATDASASPLTRWRLRLAEYDFTIQYRPGRVHQVPDALSRLVSPKNDEFDAADIQRAKDPEAGALDSPVAPPQDDLPAPLTIEEIAAEQRVDDLCQTVLARQSESRDSAFFEDHHGVLKRRHPFDPYIVQVVVPRTLRARLLRLCHNPAIAGHPGQNRMYYALRREYYWPHLAADAAATVRGCRTCAMNRVKLRKHLNRLRLFPATRPLESLTIDVLRPLPKTKTGKRFLLVITDGFSKLTQVVVLPTITAHTFNAKFFHSTCRVLGITNLYTSAYHSQTNGQVERYNRTISSMLRKYVGEHQDDWYVYVGPLMYAYNSHVHRTTRTTPFELVLSRPAPEFSLRRADGDTPPSDRGNQRAEFLKTLDLTIQKGLREPASDAGSL